MHHIRNVEANTAIPPMFAPPILQQPQPTPNIHPMNQPPNNNLMVMLSHMQQQQQQHFNHVRYKFKKKKQIITLLCIIAN